MRAGETVLVDTGPLVAIFDPSDQDHERCTAELGRLSRYRLVTTLAILTEASHLLAYSAEAQQALLAFVGAVAVEVAELDAAHLSRAAELMKKYEDLPMDLADATLVLLAGVLRTNSIFTLDRQDFSVFRIGRRTFRILPG